MSEGRPDVRPVAAETEPRGDGSRSDQVRELARQLVAASGGRARAVILYGSHQLGTNPDRHSALDFTVVVDEYRGFYVAAKEAGELHRPAWLMTSMANVLPPNVIAFTPEEGRAGIAKCLVVSREHLERGLGPRPPDHFLLGRLVQDVGVAWVASDGERQWLDALLTGARGRVLDWVAPYLDESVDAEALGRRMMKVCYRGELRPEARDRADKIFRAQAAHFRRTLGPVLEDGFAAGLLARAPDGTFHLAAPVPAGHRLRWRWHFARSKVRATLRWVKHMVTFDNWLPYVVRKVERHTGRPVELTQLELRFPLVFLWPRAIKVLLTRPPREVDR